LSAPTPPSTIASTVADRWRALRLRVVDDWGNDVDEGGVGELWFRGFNVTTGYVEDPEATAEAITDGWLHTGDVGTWS